MFTEEQKIRAIELYFKYGKKLAPVVRELDTRIRIEPFFNAENEYD